MNGVGYSNTPYNTVGLVSSVTLFNVPDGSGIAYFWGLKSSTQTNPSSPSFELVMPPYTTPATTSTGTGGSTGWGSAPSNYAFYHVAANGYPTSINVPYTYPTTNSFQKSYWPAAINASGQVIYTQPFKSATSGFTIVSLAQTYSSSSGKKGLIQIGIATTLITGLLQQITAGTSGQIGYVMTTPTAATAAAPPVATATTGSFITINGGLLLGSTTGAICNTTTLATGSTDRYIRITANYIKNNAITANTQAYISDLGCLMTVTFWTYGTAPNKIYSSPSTYWIATSTTPAGTPPAGYPATGGLQWTIVTCVTEPQATATTTVDDTNSNGYSTAQEVQGIGAVSVATLLVVVVVLFCVVYAVFFQGSKAPLAKGNDNL